MNILSYCLPCLPSLPSIRVGSQKFRIVKLLGEGGFSYIYLVKSSNGSFYALKRMRCPFGNESVRAAQTEAQNYKEFESPYIIKSIDSSIEQEADGSKTVYVLLPYFDSGSLQDLITRNVIEDSAIPETKALEYFIGICRGLQVMHHHQNRGVDANESDSEQQALLDQEENLGTELYETVAFAHRDIKPANVMLSKDGHPVLCDLGSAERAHVDIVSKSQAITVQELFEERCTLPYRAPELLDVKVGDSIDEKSDIWSLGCTLYALLYGCSPFEREEQLQGANMTLVISDGKFSFPETPHYSGGIHKLIISCLEVDSSNRPNIDEVLTTALALQK